MSPATDLVDRLFARLEAVAREERRPGAARPALTVADVYQRLIPYRGVRSELGILELAEYEHALLRLLAGEGEHLVIGSSDARDDLLRELASPNPILGVYRDYPDVEVRFAIREPDDATDPEPEPAEVTAEDEGDEAPAEPLPTLEAAPAPASCVRCARPLPDLPDLHYCPACGADQREVPCASCGRPLREEWNFCVRCGTRR